MAMRHPGRIVLVILATVCGAVLLLPVELVEPDDFDWYAGMVSFSRGHFVSSENEVREIHELMAERFGRRDFQFPMPRSEKGFVHERSPGYYGLLAAFRLVGLDRFTNIFLAVAGVLFFFHLVKKYADERIALFATLMMVLNPTFLTGLYRVYMSDFAYFVFGLFGMGAYWIARVRRKARLYFLAGFLLSVSMIFRVTNAIFFVSIAAYELCVLLFPKSLVGPARELTAQTPQTSSSRSPVSEEPTPKIFSPRCFVPLAAGLLVGIVPLLLYNYHTMGSFFAAGYSDRFSHEGTKYFSVLGRGAIFSLRNLTYTFPVGLPRLLQGYPIALLAPAGFILLAKTRNGLSGSMNSAGAEKTARPSLTTRRFALFTALWFATYWAFYLCYSTIREDSFQFMCRKFLPSLPALCVGAAAVLDVVKGKWKGIALATFAVFGIAVASEFMVRFVVPQPFGRPVFPRREPPPEAFREVARRLGAVEALLERDAEDAQRLLRESVRILKDLAQAITGPVGAELGETSRDLGKLEKELKRSVSEGVPLSGDQLTESRDFLRRTGMRMEELSVPPGGPPFGAGGQIGIPPDVLMRVELLHRLISEAEAEGIDTPAAVLLDELARIEIERRRFNEAIDFLNIAIESVGGTPPPRPLEGRPRLAPSPALRRPERQAPGQQL